MTNLELLCNLASVRGAVMCEAPPEEVCKLITMLMDAINDTLYDDDGDGDDCQHLFCRKVCITCGQDKE